jgi:hypothetical protein
MPFDLFISHAPSFDKIDKSGLFRRQQAISHEEFTGCFASLSPIARPDGDLWLQHPEDGSPWLATRLTPKGSIVLSCSYTHHRFLRNFADAFDVGVQIAAALGATLYEEVRQSRVDATNIDALLDRDGDYIELQAKTFLHAIQKMDEGPSALLEYPLGPIDLVGEYFVLDLKLPAGTPATFGEILERASCVQPPLDLQENGALIGGASGKPVFKIVLRPDDRLQIWPSHGYSSFAEIATACMATLAALTSAFPGATSALCGEPMDEALKTEVSQRATGLGIDFYLWMSQKRGG